MTVDRDLAVAFVRAAFDPAVSARGWEVTAATGIRGLRLLEESGRFGHFLFTDAHPAAVGVLERNAAGRPGAVARAADGRAAPDEAPFDYVDVDPYGSPIPFAPAAIGAVVPGGLLAVTATDMPVLGGAQPAACRRRYGANPVRGRLGPEGGLRVLLAYLARTAGAAGRSIVPELAYVRGHYVRAYVRVGDRPTDSAPIGTLDPAVWTGPPIGDGGPFGPLWTGPLGVPETIERMAVPPTAGAPGETGRFLERLRGEARIDAPFYYEPNEIAGRLGLDRPPSIAALLDGLKAAGYPGARTHARDEGIRSSAPRRAVDGIARSVAGQSQNARVRA